VISGANRITHPWLIVVVAQQRSGTTALASALSSGSKIDSLGEIFHHSPEAGPLNYLAWRRAQIEKASELSVPENGTQRYLWRAFVDEMRSLVSKPYVLVDVKYNAWHHFNPIWYTTGDRPNLLSMVREGSARVIHLIRDDVFAQSCSLMLALETKRWHSSDPGPKNAPTMRLEPEIVRRHMQTSRHQTDLFRRFFAGHSHYVELQYESMLEDTRPSGPTIAAINAMLGEDCDGLHEVSLEKVSPPISEYVSNGPELISAFRDGPFEDYVTRAFRT
jgi:LPS sulfotransferase NodH